MRSLLLVVIIAGTLPAAAQDVTVRPGFEPGVSVSRFEPMVLTLSRPLSVEDGRVAVLVGQTDLSALFVSTGTMLRYEPAAVPLPSGTWEVKVYLVADDGAWREIGRFPLVVRTRGGFDRATLDPGLTLSNKGQLVERTLPAPELEADIRIYQDFTGQADLQAALVRRGWHASANAQLLGVSYRNEALRFGELREKAPRVDLASYAIEAGSGPVSVRVGQVSHGRHRHVINGFGTRGVVAEVAAAERFAISVAALNGTRVVGWKNPFGLAEPDHRLVSGLLSVEALRLAAGSVRVEGSYLTGSVLPTTGYNQGGIPDAETSRGGGIRVLAATTGGRLRLEAGYAGSRYDNPLDPILAQGDALVTVRETVNYAHYLEMGADVLRAVTIAPRLPLNVRAAYRRERVDPLYRTVAAYVQSDRLHDAWEVQTGLGAASIQASHTRSRDNLADVPSILTTRTRQNGVGIGVPVRSFLQPTASPWAALLPMLSYSFNQTTQVAAGLPVDGGFSASHLPDQRNTVHSAGASWQSGAWSAGYRMSTSFQDNRQEGREEADFLNTTHSLSIGVTPASVLSVSVDLSADRAESRGQNRVDYTHRIGLRATLRPISPFTLTAYFAPTASRDAARTARTLRASTSIEGAYAIQFNRARLRPIRGQVFVRYARMTSVFRGMDPQMNARSEVWSINSGVSLSLF